MEPLTVALLVAAGFLLYSNRGKIFGGTSTQPNKNNVGPNGAGGADNPGKDPSGGAVVQSVATALGQIAGLFGGSKGQGTSGAINTGTSGGGSDTTGNTSGETQSHGDPGGTLVGSDIPFGPSNDPADQSGNGGTYAGPSLPDGSGGPGDTVDTESDG